MGWIIASCLHCEAETKQLQLPVSAIFGNFVPSWPMPISMHVGRCLGKCLIIIYQFPTPVYVSTSIIYGQTEYYTILKLLFFYVQILWWLLKSVVHRFTALYNTMHEMQNTNNLLGGPFNRFT